MAGPGSSICEATAGIHTQMCFLQGPGPGPSLLPAATHVCMLPLCPKNRGGEPGLRLVLSR